MRCTFIRAHSTAWPLRWLCRLLEAHPSGFYAWRKQPKSARALADERLSGLIKQFWLASGGIYGYRKIYSDLREIGECCGRHRVRRLMKAAGLRAQVGYRKPRAKAGTVSAVAESFFQLLKRERIKRYFYPTREDARLDVVDYIEMFYNSKRRHSFNDQLSPVECEKRFTERLVSV